MIKTTFRYSILTVLLVYSCKNKKEGLNSSAPQLSEYLIGYNVLVNGENDDYDIFTMNMDGGDKKNITNNPDVAWAYHADGDLVFFLSDRDTTGRILQLHSMTSDGSEVLKISNVRMRDSWIGSRKNGVELIVVPYDATPGWLYMIDRKGALLDSINTGMPFASDPTFSPDGKRISFIGKTKESKRDPDFKAEIHIVNVDGSGLKQLSNYPESDTTAEWYAYKAGPPQWHPSEDFISFQSKQNGKYSLYGVTTNGKIQWKLTDNPQEEGYHSWSPDGKWLALEVFNSNEDQFHIGLMNWETKEMKILTDTTYQYQQAPVFVKK